MKIIKLDSYVKCKDHDGYKAITTKELQWSLTKEQGDLVECQTPEGPSDDFCWHILLNNWFTGETYRLNSTIYGRTVTREYEDEDCYECVTVYMNGRSRADALITVMEAKGEIDLNNWTKI